MLVTSESNPVTPSRAPSILDSPTLARVERARLRLEASGQREDSLERSIIAHKQSLLAGKLPIASTTGPIKRGLLWQQRDRLFSRWKERYFVLTRDYLHCFKRASGSANERISDMGQFIFKVKLVDVEKVEWLNRRSYSAIGLLLGSREGRVLLRSENGLEDWFELLEECTLNSKQRRQQLRITQGPRSRASLAAPPSHASLYANHLGLGGTYSSAIEDWLFSRNKSINSSNHFILSDSVPDLTSAINDNHSGLTTNNSTPKKIPNSSRNNGNDLVNLNGSPNCFHQQHHHHHHNSPSSRIIKNKNYDDVLIEDEEEVQLRRSGVGYPIQNRDNGINNDNDNKDSNWMYRKPLGPQDQRHSLLTDIDISACDSGLDTPPSTHRPSSYRDVYYMTPGARDSTDTGVSSSRGTLVSPGGSIHGNVQQHNTNGSRYSVQEKTTSSASRHYHHDQGTPSTRSNSKLVNEFYHEINQNKYTNGNGHSNTNFNGLKNGENSIRENRYQNPALVAIINEAQGMKFRDRSYSDIQQIPRRPWNDNSSSPKRYLGTPTRV